MSAPRIVTAPFHPSLPLRLTFRFPVLAGSAFLLALSGAAPRSEAQSFETPPEMKASDLLKPVWLSSEYHSVDPTVVAELGVLFLITLQRNYNRQVEVKEQAAKAWSLIDVSLQRRHELIPNLVAVVERYAAHERTTQELVSQLRAVPQPPPTEALPSDQTLDRATEVDRGLRNAAASTAAVVEAYPDLRADSVFLDLQRRYVDAEEAVASARLFYNDAIELLRTRRGQFPGSLFARFVQVPSWNLFEAEEAATIAPSISTAPAGRSPTASSRTRPSVGVASLGRWVRTTAPTGPRWLGRTRIACQGISRSLRAPGRVSGGKRGGATTRREARAAARAAARE